MIPFTLNEDGSIPIKHRKDIYRMLKLGFETKDNLIIFNSKRFKCYNTELIGFCSRLSDILINYYEQYDIPIYGEIHKLLPEIKKFGKYTSTHARWFNNSKERKKFLDKVFKLLKISQT